ncbi:nucleotidyltransferase family protein [Salinisphaera sp. Q1T1-3]|uniref:nucleotidyltransferase family protein n=1 Tax=Salinisphaera sp. Q1T1-3 TaxID=2321229 RepID=UPI00210091D8|nr:nucleotidyltransferase family protein [Salinisphaera sp. Q1T1-3]
MPQLALTVGWLVSGCLLQTLWNLQCGHAPERGILDHDLFYFDDADTGWEAEDAVIRTAERLFADLPIDIQVRNQARVHRWYAEKFGQACAPLTSSCDGIDHFLNQSPCFGVRRLGDEHEVYAPLGFHDLFAMTLRPNPRRA